MNENQWLAEQFEANRSHLQAVAYRMLGSLAEANDAVQEAWLRLTGSDASSIENLGGWLTTVIARICLDMLRLRKAQREQTVDIPERIRSRERGIDPEEETTLADSVGVALLVILDMLSPAERLAFVLHDVFAVPFEEIAPVIDRTEAATRKLASRARRRVQGTDVSRDANLADQKTVVNAFLTASREGSFESLLTLLDPDVTLRGDATAVAMGGSSEVRGAAAVARFFSGRARGARTALINGSVGIILARAGRLFMVINLTVSAGKIVGIEAIGDPARLSQLRLCVLDG